MTPEQQQDKDREDLRYLCAHFDEILNGMRVKYETLLAQQQDLIEGYNKHVQQCEALFNGTAARLVDLDRRLRHLETGGVEDAPV